MGATGCACTWLNEAQSKRERCWEQERAGNRRGCAGKQLCKGAKKVTGPKMNSLGMETAASWVQDPAVGIGSSCVWDPAEFGIQLCLGSSCARAPATQDPAVHGPSCAPLLRHRPQLRAPPPAHGPGLAGPHQGTAPAAWGPLQHHLCRPHCTHPSHPSPPRVSPLHVWWLGLGRWSCAAAHGHAGRPGLAAGLQRAEPWLPRLLRGCRSRVRERRGRLCPRLAQKQGCSAAGPPPLSRGAAVGRRRSCVGGTQAMARCAPRGGEGVQAPAVGWGEFGTLWGCVLLPVLRPPCWHIPAAVDAWADGDSPGVKGARGRRPQCPWGAPCCAHGSCSWVQGMSSGWSWGSAPHQHRCRALKWGQTVAGGSSMARHTLP